MPAKPASTSPKAPVDWAAVRARVEHTATPTEADTATAAARTAAILARRARALATPPSVKTAAPGDLLEVVAFELGGQALAIEATRVVETVLPRDLTRLPGLPAFVRGVFNVRSRIVAAIDLRPLLQLAAQHGPDDEKLLIVAFEGAEFGVLADRVLGLRQVSASSLRRDVPGLNDKYLRGITDDGLVLLELSTLFPDLVVDDATDA